MNSTLGRYAPITAAVAGIMIIGAYAGGVLVGLPNATQLEPMALIAVGAIFGSAVVANGHKEPLRQAAVANARLDALGAPHTPALASCQTPGCILVLDHSADHRDAHGDLIPASAHDG